MTHNPEVLSSSQLVLAMDQVMQARRTVKVLGDIATIPDIPEGFDRKVQQAMKVAAWAPFHFTAHPSHLEGGMRSVVPWRFYSLDHANCLQLTDAIIAHPELDLDEESGIVKMLAGCGALVLVTWLPEPDDSERGRGEAHRTMMDEEHLAAAAAATQNLLLATKARKINTYWSSGGVLREWECFELCKIPVQEKLLGAVFMSPEVTKKVVARPGHLRDRRGPAHHWMTSVSI